MPNAQVVGRVAIRILPDTSKFKEDARAELEKIEKSLEVKAKVVLDADGVKEEAKKVRAQAQQALSDISLQVNLDDESSLKAAIGRIQNELNKLHDTTIEINLDEDELNAGLDLLRDQLRDIAKIDLHIDESSQSSIKSAIAKIDAELAKMREVELSVHLDEQELKDARDLLKDSLRMELDVQANQSSIAAAIAKIDAELAKRSAVHLDVELDEASLQAARDMLANDLRLELKLDPDSQSSLAAALAKIDAELAKRREIQIDVELDDASLQAARDMLAGDLRMELNLDWDDDASVKQAIAQINAELAKLAEVNLEVGLDEASLRQARDDLQNTLDERAQIKVDIDMAAARAAYDSIKQTISELKIDPKLDPADVKALKRQLEDAYSKMRDLQMKITPEMDAMAKAKVEREIDDLQDKIEKLTSEIEPETSKGAVALVMAEMAKLARNRTVNLIPKVSLTAAATATAMLKALSGARVLGDTFEHLNNMIKNLDKSTPIIGTLATAIAGLAGWGITAASNLFTLSASLAQIGATSLALPGILGGMAIGIGITIAAFKDFNKVLPEVKGQLSQLQDMISENFWAEAKKPIRELLDTLLPELESGFEKTSTQLGKFFGGFASSIKETLAPALGGMFDDLSKSIEIATEGTGAFANIIKVLGEVGAGYLPRLAQWFVDVAEKASDWLDRKGKSGLQEEIDAGVDALKDLGGVLYETGGILAGIARAAQEAGGSTLAMLRETLGKVHDVVDSSGAQKAMVGLFEAAHEAMSNISKQGGPELKAFFKEFVSLLDSLLPQIGDIIGKALGGIADALNQPAITNGIHNFFDGFERGIDGLLPALNPLGEALGALLDVAGELAAQLGPVLAAALIPVANAFTELAPKVTPIIELLGEQLTQTIKDLTPTFEKLVPVVGDLLTGAFGLLKEILPVISDLFVMIVEAVAPLVIKIGEELAPLLPILGEQLKKVWEAAAPLVEKLLEFLVAVIEPLIPLVAQFIKDSLPPLADGLVKVYEAAKPLIDKMVELADFVMPYLIPILEELIKVLGVNLKHAIDGVVKIFEGALKILKGQWDLWAGIFTGDWERAWEGIQEIFDGVIDVIKGIFELFLGGLIENLNKYLGELDQRWDKKWQEIKDALRDKLIAMVADWQRRLAEIRNAPGAVLDYIEMLFTNAFEDIRDAVGRKMVEMNEKINKGISDAVKYVRSLPSKAKEALGNLSSVLPESGRALIRGFIAGIESMIGDVKAKLNSLTSMLPDWKGPMALDRVLLEDSGKAVIDGFIKGLESRYDAVKKSLRGLTDDVADTALQAPGVGAFSASSGLTAAVTAALAGKEGATSVKTLNYYAAPGSSLDSEEDLFAAANRARFGW
ncbi:hypothetical protein [Streptomyces sp. NPDC056796]|uniref:hypothetical protein n=1 Tax=Streptomyces sp. NPDC056796 TaxID=3345947 RepID=UPI00368A70D2